MRRLPGCQSERKDETQNGPLVSRPVNERATQGLECRGDGIVSRTCPRCSPVETTI
jgi:hypothetical protein